jgi:hypothetical protein
MRRHALAPPRRGANPPAARGADPGAHGLSLPDLAAADDDAFCAALGVDAADYRAFARTAAARSEP